MIFIFLFRASYIKSKQLAEVGDMLEKGEMVQSRKTPSVDHCIWLCTAGAGFGKSQYRFVYFFVLHSYLDCLG